MFYLDDERSGPTASEWGVFMGTSHHEPMARADKEQNRFLKGRWDWGSNKAGVQAFMKEGAERSKNWLTMYTLGMRGSGDAASPTLTSAALEDVIKWQQSTLSQTLGKDLASIPQQWVMYKVSGPWRHSAAGTRYLKQQASVKRARLTMSQGGPRLLAERYEGFGRHHAALERRQPR